MFRRPQILLEFADIGPSGQCGPDQRIHVVGADRRLPGSSGLDGCAGIDAQEESEVDLRHRGVVAGDGEVQDRIGDDGFGADHVGRQAKTGLEPRLRQGEMSLLVANIALVDRDQRLVLYRGVKRLLDL